LIFKQGLAVGALLVIDLHFLHDWHEHNVCILKTQSFCTKKRFANWTPWCSAKLFLL